MGYDTTEPPRPPGESGRRDRDPEPAGSQASAHGGAPRSDAGTALDRLIARCRETGVRRRRERRWVAGVSVGLADRWNIDPVLVRAGFIVLTVFGGVGIALYLWCWLLLPAEDGSVALDRALRGGDGAAITLLVFTGLITIGSLSPYGDGGVPPVVYALALGGFVWWLVRRGTLPLRPDAQGSGGPSGSGPTARLDEYRSGDGTAPVTDAPMFPSAPETAPPAGQGLRPIPIQDVVPDRSGVAQSSTWPHPATTRTPQADPRGSVSSSVMTPPGRTSTTLDQRRDRRTNLLLGLLVAGLSLLAYLAAGSLAVTGAIERPWVIALAAPLAVMGLTLIATAFTRYRPTLLVVATLVMAVSLLSSVAASTAPREGTGDVRWAPTSASEIPDEYRHGIGDAELDLSAVPVDGVRHVRVSQSIGDLTVVLPAQASARVTVGGGLGDVVVEGDTRRDADDSRNRETTFTVGSGPQAYDLDLRGGLGDVVIEVADTPAPTAAGVPATDVTGVL